MNVLTTLEIDVLQSNELKQAIELAAKYKLPAIIVHPELAANAFIGRGTARGKFKIITAIDWPKASKYGAQKLIDLSIDAIETDGFEVMITPDKSEAEIANEARAITDFARNHLQPGFEVRFVFPQDSSEEFIERAAKALVKVPKPVCLRNDIFLKTQTSKACAETHNHFINVVRRQNGIAIKISGNINGLKSIAECDKASKFAVNVTQAKTIIKEYYKQSQIQDVVNS